MMPFDSYLYRNHGKNNVDRLSLHRFIYRAVREDKVDLVLTVFFPEPETLIRRSQLAKYK
jgi:hypothetical protein